MGREAQDRVVDQVGRGLGAGGEQQLAEPGDLEVAECRAVDLARDQPRDQIAGGMRAARREHGAEVLGVGAHEIAGRTDI